MVADREMILGVTFDIANITNINFFSPLKLATSNAHISETNCNRTPMEMNT